MTDASKMEGLVDRRKQAVEDLANIDHAIASLEAMEQSHMIDASCPHCDFVVQADGGMATHLRDVHPNPLIYPDATAS